jgi:hypothetical protein
MCERRDAMREVREAAASLSAVCRPRSIDVLAQIRSLYSEALDEPLPQPLLETLAGLADVETSH